MSQSQHPHINPQTPDPRHSKTKITLHQTKSTIHSPRIFLISQTIVEHKSHTKSLTNRVPLYEPRYRYSTLNFDFQSAKQIPPSLCNRSDNLLECSSIMVTYLSFKYVLKTLDLRRGGGAKYVAGASPLNHCTLQTRTRVSVQRARIKEKRSDGSPATRSSTQHSIFT